jgi:hypothetical protein
MVPSVYKVGVSLGIIIVVGRDLDSNAFAKYHVVARNVIKVIISLYTTTYERSSSNIISKSIARHCCDSKKHQRSSHVGVYRTIYFLFL